MRKRWFVEDHPGQPHLWEDDRTVAEWLLGQINPNSKSVSQVKYLKNVFFKEHLKILLFYFIYEYTFPPLKIVVVVVVNLSCRNSHIITWFSRRNFNIVGFLAFKNAYSYTVGVEFSFFNAQTV